MGHFKRKMITPVRNLIFQIYLLAKFSRNNLISKKVIFSKNTIIGKGCFIGQNVTIGTNVVIGNKVHIGRDSILENIEINDSSFIDCRVIIAGTGDGKIIIGRNSYIGISNVLDNSSDITIGDFVHIAGPSTGLWTHSSAQMCIKGIPLNEKNKEVRPTAPIKIESNVYIGGNCTIYPGITIGHHSVVAPNSAVTKNIPPFTMVGGVPAKKIKDILVNNTICE